MNELEGDGAADANASANDGDAACAASFFSISWYQSTSFQLKTQKYDY